MEEEASVSDDVDQKIILMSTNYIVIEDFVTNS
jgi:hypothetical protein